MFGVSYWLPSWLLLQPDTGPSSTQTQGVFASQEEAVQQNKAPEAEPGHLCHLWWRQWWGRALAAVLVFRASPPNLPSCIFQQKKGWEISLVCPQPSSLVLCKAQGRGLLVLYCSIIPLKNELFCLASPAPISFHHQSTLHTHPSVALPHTMRDT